MMNYPFGTITELLKDLNGLSEEQFLKQITQYFYVEEASVSPYKPNEPKTFGMYVNEKWYKLTVKEETFDANDLVKGLDVSILQDHLLSQVLEIHDPRSDSRIDFVGGIRGLEELERLVNNGEYKAAFSLYPDINGIFISNRRRWRSYATKINVV